MRRRTLHELRNTPQVSVRERPRLLGMIGAHGQATLGEEPPSLRRRNVSILTVARHERCHLRRIHPPHSRIDGIRQPGQELPVLLAVTTYRRRGNPVPASATNETRQQSPQRRRSTKGACYRSALYQLPSRINAYVVRWIRTKYRRLRAERKAIECWRGTTARSPRMFAHWTWVPRSHASGDREDTSPVTRDCPAGICGSPRVRIPWAARPTGLGYGVVSGRLILIVGCRHGVATGPSSSRTAPGCDAGVHAASSIIAIAASTRVGGRVRR
jgi:hypothetical protein